MRTVAREISGWKVFWIMSEKIWNGRLGNGALVRVAYTKGKQPRKLRMYTKNEDGWRILMS